jgi:hypothetical protein
VEVGDAEPKSGSSAFARSGIQAVSQFVAVIVAQDRPNLGQLGDVQAQPIRLPETHSSNGWFLDVRVGS